MAPSYDLSEIKKYVIQDLFQVSGSAFRDMAALGYDREDIQQCVLALKPSDFYKSDPSLEKPGMFLDVYRPWYCNRQLYVKLQMTEHARPVIVVSFKRK
jgi:hypothetical protein